METAAPTTCSHDCRRRFLCDRSALLSLLVLATLFKIILMMQSPILARDGIHHLHFAHDLAERPWAGVLREQPYHPGYAYTVLVASMIYEIFDPGALKPNEWQFCGHLSSCLAGILLVIPLYGLARCFYSIPTSWLASLLFLILPTVVQSTTDTLTESWYLLCMLSACWLLVHGVRSQCSSWFVVAGLLAGSAYLFRIEALMIPATYLVWMFVSRWQRRQLLPSGTSLRNVVLLGGCFLLPPLPYFMTIGKLSNRPVVQSIAEVQAPSGIDLVAETQMLASQRLQDGVNGLRIAAVQWRDACYLFCSTHLRAGNYFLWPLCLIGAVVVWRTKRQDPATLLLVSLLLVHTMLFWRLTTHAGYLSDRHLILGLVLFAQLAAVGAVSLRAWLRMRYALTVRASVALHLLVAVVVAGLCLPKALQPLHRSQEAHRQAGHWLAHHLDKTDMLVDPYDWASFYAGLSFLPKRMVTSLTQSTLGVIDPQDTDLNRQREWKTARLQAPSAQAVWQWPATGKPKLIIKRADEDGEWLGSTWSF